MKKMIAIVAGGDSSEHDVSLRSAAGILSFMDSQKYDVYIVEIKGANWTAHFSIKPLKSCGGTTEKSISSPVIGCLNPKVRACKA